jgi:hypothetical protein
VSDDADVHRPDFDRARISGQRSSLTASDRFTIRMQTAALLKIAKYTVEVEIRTSRGEEKKVGVFVAEELTVDGRSERLQDILDTRKFVPVQSDSGVELYSSAHIDWLRLDVMDGLDELDPQAERGLGASSVVAELELEDGSVLEGLIRYYMPPGMRRLADFLQTTARWIPLRTSEHLYLVNRDRIVRVVPVEA